MLGNMKIKFWNEAMGPNGRGFPRVALELHNFQPSLIFNDFDGVL